MRLRGRAAIVTGAGGGLGRSHALMLAQLGAKIIVNDMNEAAAERVAGEVVAQGGLRLPSPRRSRTPAMLPKWSTAQ